MNDTLVIGLMQSEMHHDIISSIHEVNDIDDIVVRDAYNVHDDALFVSCTVAQSQRSTRPHRLPQRLKKYHCNTLISLNQ